MNYLPIGLLKGFFASLASLPSSTYICNNLQSAIKEPDIVDSLLAKEVAKGYMIGPFHEPPLV